MKHLMVIAVSPLDYIWQQQFTNVTRTMCGVRAVAIDGWLGQYGGLHHTKVLVVDKVHTVETWYVAEAFFFQSVKIV